MLTISSSSLTPTVRRRIFGRRYSQLTSSDLYRPRTITIEKALNISSYGFSIQTYGFASLNLLSTDESACSLLSLSSSSSLSRKSSVSNSYCSSSQTTPIQLVTYVDHVEDKSPAWEAGLRAGSVILAVNDQSVEHDDHETLVKRITESSTTQTQLKLVIIQQNINKQIELCEKLQQLHKQLHEKQEELEELCKQERNYQDDISIKVNSPSPRLQHRSVNIPERTSSFCHDKIPLDWRQSVTNFAHQQNLTTRTLPPVLSSTSSISSSKYIKNRSLNSTQHHQRSMSLSTIVLHYSKSTLFRHHAPLLNQQTKNHRRALSYEELFSLKRNNRSILQQDDSIIASGCSLAMDLSRSFDQKNARSSSSSSTLNSDEDENKIKPFKWKLRINK